MQSLRIRKKVGLTLLGLVTFYMPFSYCVMGVWAIGSTSGIWPSEMPPLVREMIIYGIAVTFVMWPVYFAWALLNKRLYRQDKLKCFLIIFLFNMFAMPWFFVRMVRAIHTECQHHTN